MKRNLFKSREMCVRGVQGGKRATLRSNEAYILQHTATHCETLQHTAPHCTTLQRTAAHCTILQNTGTRCSTESHTLSHQQFFLCCSVNVIHSVTNNFSIIIVPHTLSHLLVTECMTFEKMCGRVLECVVVCCD